MSSRVLAVEDSPTQAERLRAHLTDAGFDVVLAADGAEALRRLRLESVDVVVSDVMMPHIDGYELCRRIKDLHPAMPVVLLTSLTDPAEVVRGLEAGADNFLRKPYDPEQLIRRIQTIVHHAEQRAEGGAGEGLEVVLGSARIPVTAERQQILDLLVASFQELVEINAKLQDREQELLTARDLVAAQLEVTERERQRLDTLLWAVPQAIVITDSYGVVTEVSDRMLAMLGLEADAVIGHRTHEVARLLTSSGEEMPPGSRPMARVRSGAEDLVEIGSGFDVMIETANGPVSTIIRAAPVRDRDGAVVAAVAAVEEIGGLSAHDLLTRLPNHTIFVDRVERAAALSAQEGRKFGVLAVMVDRFPRLRESLSPAAVDGIVAELAFRLRAVLADVDVESPQSPSGAHFADDMFGVVVPMLADETHGVRLAHALAQGLAGRHQIDGVTVDLTTTVGAVFDDRGAIDPIGLVTAAVRAARRASATVGGTVEVVDATVGQRAGNQLRNEAALRDGIVHGQLEVHYQPIVAVDEERPVGVEALVRWRHPERGLVWPNEFIPLAEETGLVVPLGWWVLEEACRQTALWCAELKGGEEMFVSVNLAASQLNLDDAAERVAAVLRRTGLSPEMLRLEITETGVVTDPETTAVRLQELDDLGVRLAIDDFGTGHSSLLQLRRFPVHALKVDRAFISTMNRVPEDATIVSASIRLAHALGLVVVAEGVETHDDLSKLKSLRCDLAQGYLWSRPLPADALRRWWEARP